MDRRWGRLESLHTQIIAEHVLLPSRLLPYFLTLSFTFYRSLQTFFLSLIERASIAEYTSIQALFPAIFRFCAILFASQLRLGFWRSSLPSPWYNSTTEYPQWVWRRFKSFTNWCVNLVWNQHCGYILPVLVEHKTKLLFLYRLYFTQGQFRKAVHAAFSFQNVCFLLA